MNKNSAEYRQTCRVRQTLERQQVRLELLINATPTGWDRSLLTEANIDLLMAISRLKRIKSGEPA